MIPFLALAGTIALFAIAILIVWAVREEQIDRQLAVELDELHRQQVARSSARHPSTRNLPSCTPHVNVSRRKVRACDLRPGDVLWPSCTVVKDRPWPMPDGTYRVVVADNHGALDLVTFENRGWENVEVVS